MALSLRFVFILISVFLFFGQCTLETSTRSPSRGSRGRRGRRRYRCDDIFASVNRMVEDRLRKFEEEFPGAGGTMSAVLGLNHDNDSARVLEMDMRLNKLSGDVQDTRNLLESQHQTLRSIRDQVNTQKEEIGRIGENFTILESVVRNLSMIADHLQDLLPTVYASTTAYPAITPVPTEAVNLPKGIDVDSCFDYAFEEKDKTKHYRFRNLSNVPRLQVAGTLVGLCVGDANQGIRQHIQTVETNTLHDDLQDGDFRCLYGRICQKHHRGRE